MEIFKYVTKAYYDAIKSAGSLDPRPEDGFVYGIPDDPDLWKEHTQEILEHVVKFKGVFPIVVLKFVIDESDPDAFVQEGDDDVWLKSDSRKPLKDYKRNNFRLPEVIVSHSIPLSEIELLDNPV
jgi:hypothetical protein